MTRTAHVLLISSVVLACASPDNYVPRKDADSEDTGEESPDLSVPPGDTGSASVKPYDGPALSPETGVDVPTDGPQPDVPAGIDARADAGPEVGPPDTRMPECSGGATRCSPSGVAIEMCSNGQWMVKETCPYVCTASACAAMCMANVPCTQGLGPCRKGLTACATNTSQPTCKDSGADDSAGGCTGGNVCKGGTCVAPCAANVSCTQGIAPCRRGATFCASPSSAPMCVEAGVDDSRGGCASSMICKQGDCVAPCKSGVACTEGIGPCRKGKTTCSSPTADPVCVDSGVDDSHQTCSGGNVCMGGTCCSPNNGQSCVSGNPCQTGTYDCAGVCHTQNKSGSCGTGAGCVGNSTKQADECISGQCHAYTPSPCPATKQCEANQCKIPVGSDCLGDENSCVSGSHCEAVGFCTAPPYEDCFIDTTCTAGHCTMKQNPYESVCRAN